MSAPPRFSLLALLVIAAPAAALSYQAPLEGAGWRSESAARACRLRQSIPRLGEVVIETAGGSARFFVQLAAAQGSEVEGPWAPGNAELAAAPPFWNPQREPRPLGQVAVLSSGRIVDFEGEQVARLLRGLKDGLAAEITGRARSGDAEVQVVALPLHFGRAWRDYDACVQKLPQPQLAAIKPTSQGAAAAATGKAVSAADGMVFDYPPGDWQLQPAQRVVLDSAIQALAVDLSLRVAIDGYGNDSYRRLMNLELSRKRAQTVSDYLTGRGVDPKRIALRFHGDEKVSARRVVVKVE